MADYADFECDGVISLDSTGLSNADLDAITQSLRDVYPDERCGEDDLAHFPDRIMDAWLVNPHVRALAGLPQLVGRCRLDRQGSWRSAR